MFTYAGTDKDDDAQLKIGLSYQSIGNVDKSREEFQRFIDYFPEVSTTQKQKKHLNNCQSNN